MINESFFYVKKNNGTRDLPGGGLDYNENPVNCLKRELQEEMGLTAINIENKPSYFITAHKPTSRTRPWIANICYEAEVGNLDFVKSDECVEIGFFNIETVKKLDLLVNVEELIKEMEK